MIKVRKFKNQLVKIYYPSGDLLCEANQDTFTDIRCQIAQNKLNGFTYEWEGKKGTIDNKGQLSDWFYGMFDLSQKMYSKLFQLRSEKGYSGNMEEEINKMVENQKNYGNNK